MKELRTRFGNKCMICGFDRWPSVLEFHHLDPKKKEDAIAILITRHNKAALESELTKCILVCCNCHYAIHRKEPEVLAWLENYYQFIIADLPRLAADVRKRGGF
jgi:predicted HNH restriction endonuclease